MSQKWVFLGGPSNKDEWARGWLSFRKTWAFEDIPMPGAIFTYSHSMMGILRVNIGETIEEEQCVGLIGSSCAPHGWVCVGLDGVSKVPSIYARYLGVWLSGKGLLFCWKIKWEEALGRGAPFACTLERLRVIRVRRSDMNVWRERPAVRALLGVRQNDMVSSMCAGWGR